MKPTISDSHIIKTAVQDRRNNFYFLLSVRHSFIIF